MELAERLSKEEAPRQFKMDLKRIREWCQQKDSLVEMNKRRDLCKQRRLDRAGQKVQDKDMEETLLNWIIELHGRNVRVSRRMIQLHAKSIASKKASQLVEVGWRSL